jgi:hypothetical protein
MLGALGAVRRHYDVTGTYRKLADKGGQLGGHLADAGVSANFRAPVTQTFPLDSKARLHLKATAGT